MDDSASEDPPSRGPDEPTLFDEIVEGVEVLSVNQAEGWERGLRRLGDIQRRFDDPIARPHTAREPCPTCRTTDALLIPKSTGDTVRCATCRRLLYHTPKAEPARKPSAEPPPRSRIRPAQRARILNRDAGRCVLCGSTTELTVGRLLSVAAGQTLGATAAELNSDANLATLCTTCDLGLPHCPSSINPRTYAAIMWRLIQGEIRDR